MDATPLDLLLLLGATARLIRLTVVDDAGDLIRVPVLIVATWAAAERGTAWGERLLACPFCIGFWLAAATAGSFLAAGHTLAWQAAAAALTLSYVAGHLVARLDLADERRIG